jgi:excisionase family DNA binding protein
MKLSEIRTDIVLESDDENKDVAKAPAPGKLGEFITTKQAAKILKVSPSRVRQFIQDGRLKTYAPEVGRRDNMLKLGLRKRRQERRLSSKILCPNSRRDSHVSLLPIGVFYLEWSCSRITPL